MTRSTFGMFAFVAPLMIAIAVLQPLIQSAAAGLSPEILNAVTMGLLSLIVTYAPGVNEWHGGLSPTLKRLFWLGLLAASTIGWLTYKCDAQAACIGLSAKAAFEVFVKVALSGVTAAIAADHLATKPRKVQARAAAAKAKSLQAPTP